MQNMILEVVSTLAVAIITGAITVLVSFLQSKIKSDRINSSLSRVESLTNATVHQLQQELVNEWKEEGKLTKEQIAHLQNLASEKVWALLDDPAAELIQSVGMDLEGLIKALVEKAVVGMKQDSIELIAEPISISPAEIESFLNENGLDVALKRIKLPDWRQIRTTLDNKE